MSFNPNQVKDSASHIRITDFQAYPMGQKIITDMGVEGWGEINRKQKLLTNYQSHYQK